MDTNDRLIRIEDKVDKIGDRLGAVDVTLAAQHESLKDHTRRSLANEQAVKILAEEMKPVLAHVSIVNALGKVSLAIIGSGLVLEVLKWIAGIR